MLTISSDTLPQTCLSYVAFRLSFQETFERIVLANQVDEPEPDGCGFLTEVPFLRGVPAHVQLDLLAGTWSRHVADDTFKASLLDESVVYAACETSARLVEDDPQTMQRFLKGGPLDVEIDADHFLASELRALHLELSNEGDFLMISQFEDMEPDAAGILKTKFDLDTKKLEPMFDILGRWSLSAEFSDNLKDLMTETELARIAFELNLK